MYTDDIIQRLKKLNLFVGFNTNVDAIKKIDSSFQKKFKYQEYKNAIKRDSKQLNDKIDLLSAIIDCMENGSGNEIKYSDSDIKHWLQNKIEPDMKRMGGQAGIMSNLLSSLGINTYVYTNTLSKEQASFFRDNENIFFPIVEDDKLKYTRPINCYQDIDTKINYIFEFDSNVQLFDTKSDSHNRFIASSDTELTNLDLNGLYGREDVLCKQIDCMILSGFQNLNRKYSDGTTWKERLNYVKEFIRRCKNVANSLNIHIEYTTSHKEDIRKGFLKQLVPSADILSMDSNELKIILSDLGENKIKDKLEEEETPITVYQALKKIRERLDIKNAKVHTLHYFMSVSKNYMEPEHIREGFKFARDVAYTKASRGQILKPEDVEFAKNKEVSEVGKDNVQQLSNYLSSKDLMKKRIYSKNDIDVVMVPNKVVDNPKYTVGLGDTVSSTTFAVENCLQLNK